MEHQGVRIVTATCAQRAGNGGSNAAPMAPADIICISITAGNTSAMPASASVPSLPTNQVSIKPTAACATMTSTMGAPRRNRVDAMGPSSKSRVRGSSALWPVAVLMRQPPCGLATSPL